MPRKNKSIPHGVGWNALVAAVILLAVRDVAKGEGPHVRAEARAFLQSSTCDGLLNDLNLPSNTLLLEAIDNGLPPHLLKDLGGFNSNEIPPTPAKRERAKRHYQKKRNASEPLVLQPMLLVC